MEAFDAASGLAVRLDYVPPQPIAGGRVRWTFTVTNHSGEQRMLTFASSQQGEVVLEADGSERYRWSRGKVFAAVIAEQALLPTEHMVFSLDDVLALEPGTYALIAAVTAQPSPPVMRGEISIARRGLHERHRPRRD